MEREDEPEWCKSNLKENPKPADKTYGDWLIKPNKDLPFRYRQFCIMFAAGATNKAICDNLGVSESWISVVKSKTLVKEEVARLQDRMFAENIEKRLKGLGPYAADIIEKTLCSEDPEIKFDQKAGMAKWLAEKLTGKASQEIKVEGNLLGNLMDKLDQMSVSGKALSGQGEVIDVTPGGELPEPKKDKWSSWISTNIKGTEEKQHANTHNEGIKEERIESVRTVEVRESPLEQEEGQDEKGSPSS